MTITQSFLGDISSVITKGTTPTSVGFEFAESGVPFLRVQNLAGGAVDLTKTPLFISTATHKALSRSTIYPGDVLISIAGTIGRAAVVSSEDPAEMNSNQAVGIIRLKNGVNRRYILHWLQSNEAQSQIRGAQVTGTITNLSLTELRKLQIRLPPLAEQKRIAAILDAADALRTKRRESLAQLDALLQSTFLTLFGDPRRQGTIGEIATSPKNLGELTRIRTGKLDANAADDDGAYPFFTCAVKPLRINKAAFDCKAVLVAGNGDLNVKYYEGKFNAYQRTYVIESLSEDLLEPRFLFAFLDLYVSELRKQAIGGVIKYIKLPYLTDAIIQLPLLIEQQRFTAIVESVERQKAAQRAHLAELDALFAALQHRAFRGEL
jgi:type I restriction enzyme S subunit